MKTQLLKMLSVVLLLLIPFLNYAQAPSLGTAADFVLFSSVGSVSNTGISHITGNVGTNSGVSTAFGNVNGVMHDVDGASAQCSADLLIAYNFLGSAVPTLFPAPLLGNGQVLTPGIYSIAGNSTMNLDLTLDGLGDPNALFIIKISGTFSTNANSKVKLVNSAKACNVFWRIDGAVNMATGTTMRGNILSGGAIGLNSGDTLEGRALTVVGAITVDNVLAYTPIGCGSPYLTGPPAPALGTVACYTLFSSNGALSNTPISSVVGDVGNNGGGSISGWAPADVTGTLHLVQDPSTIQCAVDLSTLFNTLNAMIPDIELLYPAQFGNSLVLTPHIYLLDGATTFTDTLILDAQGNADGVFVIKIINGALTTSTYSYVKLINGTQSKNVFWLVEGAVSINNYSVFRGTVIIPVGAINLVNTGIEIDGRILSLNGAITTSGVHAVMSPGCGATAPPVITMEPVNQTACSGTSVSFTVTATGADLAYQWRKGTVNLVDGGNITGANTMTLTINPATIADVANDYNVIVSGSVAPNDTSINVSLTLDNGTVITSEPISQTSCVGGSVEFSVVATGTGLTYQWRKGTVNLIDGLNIDGAINDTLTIDPIALSDTSSFYNVIVTGGCGGDTSIFVSLMLNVAPIITMEPINQTGCVGGSVEFSVVATGSGLTYQWRKGTVNLIDGLNIDGVANDTLTIDPIALSDTSSFYNVIVTDGCGLSDTSIFVSLMLNVAPVITMEPINQTGCVGGSVDFSVVASGSGLTYQWRKGTVNLIDGLNIDGVNNDTLTIDPIALSDTSSFYNVIVTDGCGLSDTSIFVSLMLNVAPIITMEPINQTGCVGGSVEFSVVASGTGLTYQWRKGTVNLIDGLIINGVTNDTLTIDPIALSDTSSFYNVIVTDGCGLSDTSIFATLIITQLPIALASSNSPVCTGSQIELTAQPVLGATYSWTGVNAFTSLVQNPIIASANLLDAGIYSLTVIVNGCSSIPSDVNVVVNNCSVNLSVVKTVDNAHPLIGRNVTFTIVATNNGPSDATGVVVTDLLQSGYTFISSTITTGSYNSVTGVWNIDTLDNGTSEILTITALVNATGIYLNTASVTGNEIDPDIIDNVSTIETYPTDFNIPEGFSPNSDGINDLFVIRGILYYPENTIVIYNRWGDKVFEASPYQNTWDGKTTMGLQLGGDKLPVGTYFYILDLGDGTDIIKGTIYLNW